MLLCDAVFLLYTFSKHLVREDPMGLVTGKEILAAAHQGGYAVGAFNINKLEILQGVAAGCVAMQSPLIIAVTEGALHYAGFAYILAMARAASAAAPIPMALHLDHGRDHAIIDQCIRGGLPR